VRGGKRPGAGRKRGTPTRPIHYYLAIYQIVDEVCRERKLNISEACKAICDEGGIKWIGPDYKTLGHIRDRDILRNRYHEARDELTPRWGWPPSDQLTEDERAAIKQLTGHDYQWRVPRRGFCVYTRGRVPPEFRRSKSCNK
jgi:hypothetical protein